MIEGDFGFLKKNNHGPMAFLGDAKGVWTSSQIQAISGTCWKVNWVKLIEVIDETYCHSGAKTAICQAAKHLLRFVNQPRVRERNEAKTAVNGLASPNGRMSNGAKPRREPEAKSS